MMGNVELYHQYRWRELRQRRYREKPVMDSAATAERTSALQNVGVVLIRLGARLAGPAVGRAALGH